MSKLNKKTNLFVIFLVFTLFFYQSIHAGSEHNVWGFSWSENIGWISFNSTNTGATINYGVTINSDGTLSGYAWSENIGWIKLDPPGPYPNCPPTTCPSSPNYSARLDFGTKKVTGWARALSGTMTSAGGFDGWILLGPISKGGVDYGVWLDINTFPYQFKGWAFGGKVIGWLSFNTSNFDGGADYKVLTNFAPAPNPPQQLSESWEHCSFYQISLPIFNWDYSHLFNVPQGGYQIKIYGESTLDITSDVPSTSYTPPVTWVRNNLIFGKTYSWQVRVKDVNGKWSNWSPLRSFQMPKHAYPWIDFSWEPLNPTLGEIVQFIDLTEVFGNATKTSWHWIFQDGDPPESTLQNPQTKFTSVGQKTITLTVTDSDGFSCTRSKTHEEGVKIVPPLPKWKEIPPILWLRKFLAAVLQFF